MTSPVSTLIDVGGANAIFNHMAVACAQCADVPNAGQCPQAQLHLTIVPGGGGTAAPSCARRTHANDIIVDGGGRSPTRVATWKVA